MIEIVVYKYIRALNALESRKSLLLYITHTRNELLHRNLVCTRKSSLISFSYTNNDNDSFRDQIDTKTTQSSSEQDRHGCLPTDTKLPSNPERN